MSRAPSRAVFLRIIKALLAGQSDRREIGSNINRTGHLADDSRNTDVGERYAQALFELALQADAIAAVEKDLKALDAARLESADLRRLLASPLTPQSDKAKGLVAVAEALGVSELTRRFVGVLSNNGRAGALGPVVKAFAQLAADHRGAVAAEVITAVPLTPAQAEGVAAALRQALGKDPELSTRVDPAILGGLKVRVGSRLFDASLRSKLDSLKFALKRA